MVRRPPQQVTARIHDGRIVGVQGQWRRELGCRIAPAAGIETRVRKAGWPGGADVQDSARVLGVHPVGVGGVDRHVEAVAAGLVGPGWPCGGCVDGSVVLEAPEHLAWIRPHGAAIELGHVQVAVA